MGSGRRWWHRLSITVTAVLTISTAISGAVLLTLVLRAQRQLLQEHTLAHAALLSDTIVSSLHRHMLRNERTELTASLSEIAGEPLLADLRLFDTHGRIHFSKQAEEVGAVRTVDGEPCTGCHQSDSRRAKRLVSRNHVVERPARRVLATMTPIQNRTECSTATCHAHSPDQKVLGLLEADT